MLVHRAYLCWAALLLILFCTSGCGEPSPGGFFVLDQRRHPISDASVEIDALQGSDHVSQKTNHMGLVMFPVRSSGIYKVKISHPEYESFEVKIPSVRFLEITGLTGSRLASDRAQAWEVRLYRKAAVPEVNISEKAGQNNKRMLTLHMEASSPSENAITVAHMKGTAKDAETQCIYSEPIITDDEIQSAKSMISWSDGRLRIEFIFSRAAQTKLSKMVSERDNKKAGIVLYLCFQSKIIGVGVFDADSKMDRIYSLVIDENLRDEVLSALHETYDSK